MIVTFVVGLNGDSIVVRRAIGEQIEVRLRNKARQKG